MGPTVNLVYGSSFSLPQDKSTPSLAGLSAAMAAGKFAAL